MAAPVPPDGYVVAYILGETLAVRHEAGARKVRVGRGKDAQVVLLPSTDSRPRQLHWCSACAGWVSGQAERRDEAGPRFGHGFYCRACGSEVAFIGR